MESSPLPDRPGSPHEAQPLPETCAARGGGLSCGVRGGVGAWRCAVVIAYAALLFPVSYTVYKFFDGALIPTDTRHYMRMVEDPWGGLVHPPFCDRVLTPALVRWMDPLPVFRTPIAYTTDPRVQGRFFHFVALNALFAVLAAAVLADWLRPSQGAGPAFLAGLLHLLAFYSVVGGLAPLVDAGCFFFIALQVWCLDRKKPWALAVVAALAGLQKETALIVSLGWVALSGIGRPRAWGWGLALLPGVLTHLACRALIPADRPAGTLEAMLHRLPDLVRPGTYHAELLYHLLLGNLPLLLAFAGWLALGRVRRGPLPRELALLPALFALAIALGTDANAGRIMYMAFPAIALFQAGLLRRWVLGTAVGCPGEAQATQAPPRPLT